MHYTRPVPERTVPAWQHPVRRSSRRRRWSACSPASIVFIGAGAVGLRDLVSTPLQDRELGVMVHAQAVEQMVLGDFLDRPDWSAGLEMAILLVRGPGAGPLAAHGSARCAGRCSAAALMALRSAASSWYAFRYRDLLLDPDPAGRRH